MCTYVIWEEFWKGIELPVSPLISDCSLCKREPWHLCKGSRGLSLVSRNQFELSLLEIYIFHSACAIQLVFLISDWSLAGTVFLSASFIVCTRKEVLQNNIFSKCNILLVYHFWLKQEKLEPILNLEWIFVRTHKKQSFVLQLNLVNGEISNINNFGCQKSKKILENTKTFFLFTSKTFSLSIL